MVNKHISQNTKLFILAQIHLKTLKRQEIWWKPVSSWDLRQRPASVCKNVVEESSGNKRGLSENTLVLNSTLSSAYSHTNLHKFHSLSHGLWLERVISLSLGGSTGRSHWGLLLSHWMHPGITPGGLRVGLKIVGFVHILKHVCLDAQKRNRCSAFLCVCVCERKRVHVCIFVSPPVMFVRRHQRAHGMRTHCSCVCLCVCMTWQRGWGGGLLYWKVLLSSPVQHAGLAPAVSHGAVPPSPLPICIRRRQAEMWQTNLAHTAPAASLPWTLSPLLATTRRRHKMELQQKPTCTHSSS